LDKNKHGYAPQRENKYIPLKRFLNFESCGSYVRGYKAWKNQEYYYKCNTQDIGKIKGLMAYTKYLKGKLSILISVWQKAFMIQLSSNDCHL
jgi:hypothetical protein